MARAARVDVGDCVYHVINRANGRATIFHSDGDYLDFEYLLNEMRETYDMRIVAYVIMPNHWHMLLYPKNDGDMGRALKWLGTAHVRRHHARKKTVGHGHLYQGRYKSFLIEDDAHLMSVLKYIERNPVRANLASKPHEWRWGSAYRRRGSAQLQKLLDPGPTPLPHDYASWITVHEPAESLGPIRHSINSSVPFGEKFQVQVGEDKY